MGNSALFHTLSKRASGEILGLFTLLRFIEPALKSPSAAHCRIGNIACDIMSHSILLESMLSVTT